MRKSCDFDHSQFDKIDQPNPELMLIAFYAKCCHTGFPKFLTVKILPHSKIVAAHCYDNYYHRH
jgi:hypothetical protein